MMKPKELKTVQLTAKQFEYIEQLSAAHDGSYDSVLRMQRLSSGSPAERYQKTLKAIDEMRLGTDPRICAAWAEANAELKAVSPGSVHQNATLSNMSVQYANEEYIGTQLMPVLQVGKESDIYYVYPQRERLQYPDDTLGDRGQATEIQESRSTASYTCLPYGYSNFVAARTLANQDAPLDEMVDVVDSLNEGLAFRRELRIASVLTTAANYGSNTQAIAAANQWNTPSGGNPIADIQTMLAAIWSGRGASTLVGFTSLDVYNVLSRNPSILDLFKYNGSSPGLATPAMIASLLGFDRLLVGKARKETANEAATAVYARVWSDVFGIVRVAQRASLRNAVFGYTHRCGQPITTVQYDALKGHGGGYTAQVSALEAHDVVASATGYLTTTPIG